MATYGDMNDHSAESFDPSLFASLREFENDENRSGSVNFQGSLGDGQQEGGGESVEPKPRKYQRHSESQTEALESLFMECQYPNEKQRLELSRKCGLDNMQIKFWFQNRRTQLKNEMERHEYTILKDENEKLLAENVLMKEAMSKAVCTTCGGLAVLGSFPGEEFQHQLQNTRLSYDVNGLYGLANESSLGRTLTSVASPLEIPNTFSNGAQPGVANLHSTVGTSSLLGETEKCVLLDIASTAMDEFMRLAEAASPLWVKTLEGEEEVLNREEYLRSFNSRFGLTPAGYVTEATRVTAMLIIGSRALVEIFTDPNQWREMFKGTVAVAQQIAQVSQDLQGFKNGAVVLMHAEMQVLSPLLPLRRTRFLRFSKQHAEGFWAIVDISLEDEHPFPNCRRLPSGILVQDMPNGCSKVICIEHSEYDESAIHQLYKPLVSSGMAFGANSCIATIQRQCQSYAMMETPSLPSDDDTEEAIGVAGKKSLWKLTQRMIDSFSSGLYGTGRHYWQKIYMGILDYDMSMGDLTDMRLMFRLNRTDPSEPIGYLLSAATSVWMPVSRDALFRFLKDEQLRSGWGVLGEDEPMKELTNIATGLQEGNSISILCSTHAEDDDDDDDSSQLILQNSWTDASSSLIVYAPVDKHSLNAVLNGEEASFLALQPSGFAIYPDAQSINGNGAGYDAGGCLLTVAIQIPIDEKPPSKLTGKTAKNVNSIMTRMMQKIKASFGA